MSILRISIILILCLTATTLKAESLQKVFWATPVWDKYTNRDGSGLYNEIINLVFHSRDIEVVQNFVPWKRALLLVKRGKADFTGADEARANFLSSRIPIMQSRESIFIHKRLVRNWKGLRSLDNLKGVWPLDYVATFPPRIRSHFKGRGNSERRSGILMVLKGRRDYYLDNNMQLNLTLNSIRKPFNRKDYKIVEVYTVNLSMLFHNSPRGRLIRKIFDRSLLKLRRSGRLKPIYRKYGFTYPR